MSEPTITLIDTWPGHRSRYRIEGGTLGNGWEARPGKAAWCEFSVWHGGDVLGCYGGEVWPTAWPELFEAIPACAALGSGGIRITEAGLRALAEVKSCPEGCPEDFLCDECEAGAVEVEEAAEAALKLGD